MQAGPVDTAAAALRSAVDGLLDLDLTVLTGTELAALFAEVEVQRRRLESVDHVMVVALEERGLVGDFGRTGVAELLIELVRVAPGEAKARVRAARELGPRRDLGGVALAPVFARVAAAQRAGTISAAHAKVICDCLTAIPAAVRVEASGAAEAVLVEQAEHFDPRQLAAIGRRLLATLDPDGAEPRDEAQHRARGYGLHQRHHGRWEPVGTLTDDFAAVWTAILDPLSAPHPAEDGAAYDRSPAQRRHDAMLELGLRLLRCGQLPDAGGVPATVLLSLTADELTGDDAAITLDTAAGTGATISRTAALRLADQCELFTTVFDRAGAVLCAGRTRRLATATQRRILAVRDRGCCFPGCTRPPSWCQAHHVVPWLLGGATDLDNLVLMCGYHHREFERLGWIVRVRDGLPEWLPPPWLDPDQHPRRNTAHHLPDSTFLSAAQAAYRTQRADRQHGSAAPEPPDP